MVIDGKKQQQRKHSNVEFLNLFSPSILIPLHIILQNKKSLACPTFIFTTSFFCFRLIMIMILLISMNADTMMMVMIRSMKVSTTFPGQSHHHPNHCLQSLINPE